MKTVIKFCAEAGKSPMETRRSLDAAGDGPWVSWTMVYEWFQRLKDERTDICDDEWATILPKPCTFAFCLLYFFFYPKSNLLTKRLSDLNGLRYATIEKTMWWIMVWRYIRNKKKTSKSCCWRHLTSWKYEMLRKSSSGDWSFKIIWFFELFLIDGHPSNYTVIVFW